MDAALGRSSDTTVMIFDAMSLRRAGFSSLLAGWAQSKGLTLKSSDLTENDLVDRCKMLVLCIGSHTFDDANLVQKIKAIQAQRPEAIPAGPSDRDEPDEMVRAFQVGFRGFIPTGLEPAIVFQALNFIMNGGWFLPPTILDRFLAPTDIAINGPGPRAEGGQGSEVRPVHGLTMRQHEVIELLHRGISNKVIGLRTPADGGDSQGACSADHEKARRLEPDAGCLDLRGRAEIPDVEFELARLIASLNSRDPWQIPASQRPRSVPPMSPSRSADAERTISASLLVRLALPAGIEIIDVVGGQSLTSICPRSYSQ